MQEVTDRLPINIEEEMKRSYLDYAMSVIIGRALPDVRDGLKPVHRRILWAMHESGLQPNRPYRKSATVVGDVLGRYHPHGDSSVYDAMVRLVQHFSMREPLVDGQGNFGSVDGDAAAAYRYTEARLTRIATEMMADIEKETVDFQPNFDESREEPKVLPTRFPNLLVNGSGGIAVGMATNIPPHNLHEIVEATIRIIENPEVTTAELIKIVPGPDFPTGGFIYGRRGIRDAYETGRGSILMRAKAAIDRIGKHHDREAIVVTEIPYQVNKARLIELIASLVNEKKLEGVSDLRDESDRDGMRIVIELKRDAIAQVVINKLYKMTPMQTSFGVINLSIVNGQPQILPLKETLGHFVEHRREVVTRRTQFELAKAEARAHILEGLKKAIDNLDAVIKLIRASKSVDVAKAGLIEKFELSERQAKAILEMQLQRLTGLERQKLIDEYEELIKLIAELGEILASDVKLRRVIVSELRDVQKEFGTARRTEILDEAADFRLEDLIADEDVAITVTHNGYIKRTPVSTFREQRRGGIGRKGAALRTEDVVDHIFVASTHSYLMILTNRGQVYKVKVHEIPDAEPGARGKAIVNLIQLPQDQKVAGFIPVREFAAGRFVVMVSRKGVIKKTELSSFANIRSAGIIAMGVDEDDELIAVAVTDGTQKIFLATHKGMAIVFEESDVRDMGRQARGVRGIKLAAGDYVVSAAVMRGNEQVLSIAEGGYGKRTDVTSYRFQTRGGKGVINMKTTEKTGKVVGAFPVSDESKILVITEKGKLIRTACDSIRQTGRSAQGVKIVDTGDGDRVASVSLIEREDADIDGKS
ncbi:MAG TPA: DNA gyrase subunit A [Blastocatellia bacterium]|nr:DNA gyrase subunit A [Blastocatellia bacterium]